MDPGNATKSNLENISNSGKRKREDSEDLDPPKIERKKFKI